MTALTLLMGAAVGVILALTGAGGGILAVPMLVFGLHMSLVEAAPVGLLAVGLASAVGALLGLREGVVRYRAAAIDDDWELFHTLNDELRVLDPGAWAEFNEGLRDANVPARRTSKRRRRTG